jgi:hypothetical protein
MKLDLARMEAEEAWVVAAAGLRGAGDPVAAVVAAAAAGEDMAAADIRPFNRTLALTPRGLPTPTGRFSCALSIPTAHP